MKKATAIVFRTTALLLVVFAIHANKGFITNFKTQPDGNILSSSILNRAEINYVDSIYIKQTVYNPCLKRMVNVSGIERFQLQGIIRKRSVMMEFSINSRGITCSDSHTGIPYYIQQDFEKRINGTLINNSFEWKFPHLFNVSTTNGGNNFNLTDSFRLVINSPYNGNTAFNLLRSNYYLSCL